MPVMALNEDTRSAFAAMFEHASLGILVSNSNGTIEQVNPHAAQTFGYAREELIGKKIEVLLPPQLHKKHIEHRANYNQHPKPRTMGQGMDLFAQKKDGSVFPVEISLAYYENSGKREIVSFVSDITQRKTIEEQLKQLNFSLEEKVKNRTTELSEALMELSHTNSNLQQEMEQRKKAEEEVQRALEKERELGELKTRFVSMASHEFRTPLSGIMTSAALIARYQGVEDAEKRERHVQTIKASVLGLTNILNDFLSLDKLEQGKTELKPTKFLLHEFVQELLEEIRAIMKNGQYFTQRHEGEKNEIELDRNMLRNILINLLSNAAKYSADGAEIHVYTSLQGNEISITIQDHGIGIPQAEQKHLFERFFRAQNVTTIQGTGLGLNIVKRYVDLLGGRIAFVSEEHKGSSFTITLPRG